MLRMRNSIMARARINSMQVFISQRVTIGYGGTEDSGGLAGPSTDVFLCPDYGLFSLWNDGPTE